MAGVVEVLDAYGAEQSNLRRAAFRAGFDGRDGFTLSLWRSDEGMRQAAYHLQLVMIEGQKHVLPFFAFWEGWQDRMSCDILSRLE